MSTNMYDKIVEMATNLFTQRGIREVSMDDVAAECGISKKTVYVHFKTKSDLLEVVLTKIIADLFARCYDAAGLAENAIGEALLTLDYIGKHYRYLAFSMLDDIRKYYFSIWERLNELRWEIGTDLISTNIIRGKLEGLFHQDVDVRLTAELRLVQLTYIHQQSGRNDFQKLLLQSTSHFLMGMCTAKGREAIHESLINQSE